MLVFCVFFFKQKTAYEMRISDWSSDVCSSDLPVAQEGQVAVDGGARALQLVAQACHGHRVARGLEDAVQREDAFVSVHGAIMARERLGVAARVARGVSLAGRACSDDPCGQAPAWPARSEARRGGTECVSTCRSLWSPNY